MWQGHEEGEFRLTCLYANKAALFFVLHIFSVLDCCACVSLRDPMTFNIDALQWTSPALDHFPACVHRMAFSSLNVAPVKRADTLHWAWHDQS